MEENKLWYCILKNGEENNWETGSFDKKEAIEWALRMDCTLIGTIKNDCCIAIEDVDDELLKLISKQAKCWVREKDIEAIKKLYDHLDFSAESIINDYENNYLTSHECGYVKTTGAKVEYNVWWYLDENHEAAIRVDTMEFLTSEEIEKFY